MTQAASGVARCAVNVPSDLVPLLEKIKTAQGMTRRHKFMEVQKATSFRFFFEFYFIQVAELNNSLGKCSSNPLIQYLYHMFPSISLPLTNL